MGEHLLRGKIRFKQAGLDEKIDCGIEADSTLSLYSLLKQFIKTKISKKQMKKLDVQKCGVGKLEFFK